MNLTSRVTILVKALPQPSKRYIETVCCAGIDSYGNWKRLYPVRFRLLEGEKAFKRWNVVQFSYALPKNDKRIESCHVYEDKIEILGKVSSQKERSNLLNSVIMGSEYQAFEKGMSLALVRPSKIKFSAKKRSLDEIAELRERYSRLNKQSSFLDPALETFEPSPFDFKVSFEDEGGIHNKQCGD